MVQKEENIKQQKFIKCYKKSAKMYNFSSLIYEN